MDVVSFQWHDFIVPKEGRHTYHGIIFYHTITRRHNPEDCDLNLHLREYLKRGNRPVSTSVSLVRVLYKSAN
jgi:hypothetical protein